MSSFMAMGSLPPINYPGDEKYPLFNRISIEPISYCNRSCSFCPVAWNDRGTTHMTDALYAKIVWELAELKFAGVAQLFLLSEPMIDHTLLAKARLLREACPDVSMYISSNGDVLDRLAQKSGLDAAVAKLGEYYDAGINVINVNSYDPGPDQLARYHAFEEAAQRILGVRHTDHKYAHHSPTSRRLCITDMRFGEREEGTEKTKGTDVFYIRNAHERAALEAGKVVVPQKYCARTQRHIVVLFDGRVPICCAIDPADESLLVGDINTQSLEEVWNSKIFFQYRYFTQQARRVLPGCNTCTHTMAFPHIVRKVAPDPELAGAWEAKLP